MDDPTRILRRREVVRRTGFHFTTLWRMERSGGFPARIQLGPNSVSWLESEIDSWIKSRIRGGGRPVRRAEPSKRRRGRVFLYDEPPGENPRGARP
jgi:prophage regulatory protein